MTMSRRFSGRPLHWSAHLGLIAGWLALTCGSGLASVIVWESSVPGIQRGQELADDRQLNIPFGTHLLVITGQDNKVKQVQINGPRTGRIAELLNPQPLPARLISLLLRLAQTGGAEQTGMAAARGARGGSLLLNGVGLASKAAICLEENALPTITPVPDSKDTSIYVTNQQGTQSPTLDLRAPVSWPANIPIKDDGVYRLVPNNSPWVEVRLRIVPHGVLGDVTTIESLDALEARGCRLQITAALNKIVSQR
jgi:hypothetical protein